MILSTWQQQIFHWWKLCLFEANNKSLHRTVLLPNQKNRINLFTFAYFCYNSCISALGIQYVILFPLDESNFGISLMRIAMYYYRLGILDWNEMKKIFWRVGHDLWWLSIFWYTTHKTVRTTSNKNNNSTNSIFHQYRSLAHQYELAIARRIASFADKEGIRSCAVS